ncbi:MULTISPECIES: hypothetical protein [unclassified Streptomyces]|uniref:hypothetical protein n=1 Tax=unclassified Streptomyces TaxID=2593676 RepID=UPI00224D45D5|nr:MULTISPECIES: hypothetical protein [unclassified Streptomyces]MCX4991371.1 hypothetical protein [Streptomyces sp. NBC_00568]MCX5003392.1 hypothetical protein [Streptomyces sp. NBC_00638]
MRCLLTADLDLPSEGLKRVMRRLGADILKASQLPVDWLTQTPEPPVDFVCAVLGKGDNRDAEAAVLVDIGVALGRRTPVFLVLEPPRRAPLVLAGVTLIEADLRNEEALELHLKQFLRTLRRKTEAHTATSDLPALSRDSATLAHLRLKKISTGEHFQNLILEVLDSRAAEVSELRATGDMGYDAAIWADEASPILGGPVLVQLKMWISAPRHGLTRAVENFSARLSTSQVPFGLLIYHSLEEEQGERRGSIPSDPRVVTISAHELVDALSTQPLSSLLVSMRNAVVHGVPYRA